MKMSRPLVLRRLHINLLWEPRDLWFGVFVKERYWEMGKRATPVYVAPFPTLVLLFTRWSP